MNLKIEKYTEQITTWPKTGYHIMAQYDEQKIVVYQSYRPEIGHFAIKNQYFGGSFSLNRMTWIKPNFLWMMFRNGWGAKEGQEVTLAIHLKIEAFKRYLENAEYSTFGMSDFIDERDWKSNIARTACRLQWDPDHDPYGNKLERRAIQIGIRNEEVKRYVSEDIIKIEDISDFVQKQRTILEKDDIEKLYTPLEKPLIFDNQELNLKLKIHKDNK